MANTPPPSRAASAPQDRAKHGSVEQDPSVQFAADQAPNQNAPTGSKARTTRDASLQQSGRAYALVNDLPSLCVRRPYLAAVLNLLIIIAGIGAIFGVEVRELPDVDRAVVSIRANYPGGSPETIDAEITSKVEAAVARVAGIVEVRSASEEGNFRIRAEFRPSTDLIAAANDVREAVNRVRRRLPDGVENLTVVKADADSSPIVQLAVTSASLSIDALSRRVEAEIVPELTAVDGVADVQMGGQRSRVLRVVFDPVRLSSHGLSVTDVVGVLENARFDRPAGSYAAGAQTVLVRADASAEDPRAIEDLVIRSPVRLGDVATAYFGPDDEEQIVRLNGSRVITLGIVRRAQSNTVAISDAVNTVVERLRRRMSDLKITTSSDDAVFINSAVTEVLISLSLAVLIVLGIIAVFLRDIRLALIPAVSIPVALTGAIAAIWLLGFSINLVTLLALVLATGLVVDDAIVVLENIERVKSEGAPPRAAAVIGTRQVFFAVIATTATLISVFLPISFLPSTSGRLFTEFGVVLSVAVCISSFVALSVVAVLASRIPARGHAYKDANVAAPASANGGVHDGASTGASTTPTIRAPTRRGSRVGRGLQRLYTVLLDGAIAAPLVVIGLCFVTIASAAVAYTQVGEELVPSADRGRITIGLTGPEGVGLDYTDRQIEKVEAIVRPYLDQGIATSVLSITGAYDPNYGEVRAPLVDWSARSFSEFDIGRLINRELAEIPGASAYMWSGNSLNLRGGRGGSGIQFAITGPDYDRIAAATAEFVGVLESELPELQHIGYNYRAAQPQIALRIDRRRAADLNVPLDDLVTTVRAIVDRDEVAELTIDDRRTPIIVQAVNGAIKRPADLTNIFVGSTDGGMVSLAQLVSLTEKAVPGELQRQGQRRAVRAWGRVSKDATMREVVTRLEQLAARELPEDMGLLLLGEAATLDETSSGLAIVFSVAMLVVFLVLVAQFESLTSAAIVLLTVPLGICAAIFALAMTGTTINIYSQIGILMLIGIMAKNAILMVEFADQLRDRGACVIEAAREASIVRLRPIVMTMLSTVLAGLPLILATGAGAEARSAIGWVVFGGLGIATLFTLFLAPALYVLIAWMSTPRALEAQRTERELSESQVA